MKDKKIHVVRILSHKELVIDAGSEEGITNTTSFDILESAGDPIRDLDNQIIGYLPSVKASVGVLNIHDHFSIIGYTKTNTLVPASARINTGLIRGMGLGLVTEPNNSTLNVDSDDITPRVSASFTNPIKVGDEVIIH